MAESKPILINLNEGVEGDYKMKFAVLSLALLLVACTDRSTTEDRAKAEQVPIETLLAEVDKLNDQCRGGSGDSPKTTEACDKRDAKFNEVVARGWCWGPKDAIGADQHWMRCADDKPSSNQQDEWFGMTERGNCNAVSVSEATQMLERMTHGQAVTQKKNDGTLLVSSKYQDGSTANATLYPSCNEAYSANNIEPQPEQQVIGSPQKQEPPQSPSGTIVSLSELKKMTVVGMEPFKPYRVSTMINALDLGTDGLCDRVRYDGYCETERERVYVNLSLDSQASRGQLYDLRGRTGAAICATVVMHPRNVNGTLNLVGFTPGRCS